MPDSDRVDFEQFYDAHIDELTRALTTALGDRLLAQDAAQESMARAYQRWRTIETYKNPAGWCYRVGMNWATSRWRRRKREVLSDTFEHESTTDTSSTLPEKLQQALLELPRDQRDIIVLRLIEDWSIADTAEALEIPEGTVQSRYSRALKRLRTRIGEADD